MEEVKPAEDEDEVERTRLIEERLQVKNNRKSGADWFFWIAGLSLINTAILLSGSDWSFIVGLGITQFADVIIGQLGTTGMIVALVFDIICAGIFVAFGVFARKGHNWSFIVGMILYALDGLLFIMVQDWLSMGFHAFALYSIYNGYQANQQLSKIQLPPAQTVNSQQ